MIIFCPKINLLTLNVLLVKTNCQRAVMSVSFIEPCQIVQIVRLTSDANAKAQISLRGAQTDPGLRRSLKVLMSYILCC